MFHLVLRELSCPHGEVNVHFPQHHMTTSPPYTHNGSDGKGYFLPLISVGVEYLPNVLELLTDP